ncbi:MAG: site-specific integrase [bacterium]|nr:site-specific integrase [bacterium]
MGKYAQPEKQARSVTNALQKSGAIKSFGTARGYTHALTRVCEYVKAGRLGSLRDITPEQATTYLKQRAEEVGQKQLDMERQAMQSMMKNLTGKLEPNARLTVIKSEHQQVLTSRSYTPEQVAMVAAAQRGSNALSTQIAYAAGLRGHELLTLRRLEERHPNKRPTREEKFKGREGIAYSVKGKGGLIREVSLPTPLAQQLEARRFDTPKRVTDRGIHYAQNYAINGGQKWSSSFGQASNRALGWSAGAHGLRHSYAQERMHELQASGLSRNVALETVSQEMGHFRPEITEVYLR